jgi:hypothetical protein
MYMYTALKVYTVGQPQLMKPPEMLRRVWSEAIKLLSLHLPITRDACSGTYQWWLVGLSYGRLGLRILKDY